MENEIIEVCDESADEAEAQNLNQSSVEAPNFSQIVSSYYQTLLGLMENGPSGWIKIIFDSRNL
jgi:hypothetical protein